jgi:hypothetical protein
MLVPSMNLAEIRKEIDKDYPIVYRKMGYVGKALTKSLSPQAKKAGFQVFYEYRSPNKNHWIYRVYGTKKKTMYEGALIYHTGKNLVAITVTAEIKIIYHTHHFFERYNQRLNLGLTSFSDLVRHFLGSDIIFIFHELEEIEPNVWSMFCLIPKGAILGTYYRKLEIMKANTFVTTDMLHEDQHEMRMFLKEKFKKYVSSSSELD